MASEELKKLIQTSNVPKLRWLISIIFVGGSNGEITLLFNH